MKNLAKMINGGAWLDVYEELPYVCHCEFYLGIKYIQEIDPWCEEYLQGRFAILRITQWFEFEEDLVLFLLRWG